MEQGIKTKSELLLYSFKYISCIKQSNFKTELYQSCINVLYIESRLEGVTCKLNMKNDKNDYKNLILSVREAASACFCSTITDKHVAYNHVRALRYSSA